METLRKPSSLPTPNVLEKQHQKNGCIKMVQLETFLHKVPRAFNAVNPTIILFFIIWFFDEETQFPKILEVIKVDDELARATAV